MMQPIYTFKKARYFGFWKMTTAFLGMMFPLAVSGAGGLQTVYTETPVQSYYAYPEDVNFVPETEFMQREDSLNYDDNIAAARGAETLAAPGVGFGAKPAVICRDYGCTKLNDRITRTFLFNSLSNTFMMNSHSRINICEADPFTRSCLQSGISFPARIGVANALVKISRATISQVNISTGMSRANIGITYDFLVNGISRRCEPTVMEVIIPSNSTATLANREFGCAMTADGKTAVSLLINIDYIDLDYGILGGYYSFGIQGPTAGGGTGYALFKMDYTNKGMKMTTDSGMSSMKNGVMKNENGVQVIQPGEYAVAPLTDE